jgi:ribosome-binding factor A
MRHEISLILAREMKDRRVGLVTITGLDLSPDLRHARAFVSSIGPESEQAAAIRALNHAAGWVRHELGQRIRVKFLPDLTFQADTSQKYGEHIDELLDQIRKE